MFLATSNKTRQLLCVSYIDEVEPEELAEAREDVIALVAELEPGFRMLADFSHMKSMSVECFAELGVVMELLDRSGMGMVVRVVPDESKDIGFNILAIFHYQNQRPIVTCQKMTEAARALGL